MTEDDIKALQFFGQEGLIMQAKANLYYKTITLTQDEISLIYEKLRSNKSKLSSDPNGVNFMCICLYFQSLGQNADQAAMIFVNHIESTLKETDPETEVRMVTLYNIIEFEEKFHNAQINVLQGFLNYLNKVANIKKTAMYYLLHKYYMMSINFLMGNFKEASNCYYDLSIAMDDKEKEVDKSSTLYRYLKMRASLLFIRIERNSNDCDLNEFSQLANILFFEFSNTDCELFLKIGFDLFDIYKKTTQINNCTQVLDLMSNALNRNHLQITPVNMINYSIQISMREAYCHILNNDKYKLNLCINNMQNLSNSLITNNQYNINNIKMILDYIILVYSITNNICLKSKNEIMSYIETFKQSLISQSYTYIVFDDYNEIYNNIFAINNADSVGQNLEQNIEQGIAYCKGGRFMKLKSYLPFFYSIYNLISNYIYFYINDQSVQKRKIYFQKIQDFCENILNCVYVAFNNNDLFKLNVIQEMIIRIYYVQCYLLFLEGNKEKLNEKLAFYDEIIKLIKNIKANNNELPSFGLMFKLKGDICFKNKQFDKAIDNYESANSFFNSIEYEKEKALTLCNLGLCYILENNINDATDILLSSTDAFRQLLNKECYNKILCKIDMKKSIEDKIEKINSILLKIK